MSKRFWLENRYLIPGYIFIIMHYWVLGANFFERYGKINIFTSLMFIGGGWPIGFMISQIWYFFGNLLTLGFHRLGHGPVFDNYLRERFPKENDEYRGYKIASYHFITRNINKHMPLIDDYLIRRWDLINLIGSTAASLWLFFLSILYQTRYFSYDLLYDIKTISCFIKSYTICSLFSIIFLFVQHRGMVYYIITQNLFDHPGLPIDN